MVVFLVDNKYKSSCKVDDLLNENVSSDEHSNNNDSNDDNDDDDTEDREKKDVCEKSLLDSDDAAIIEVPCLVPTTSSQQNTPEPTADTETGFDF